MKAAPTSELRFEQRVWHRIMHSDTLRIGGEKQTNNARSSQRHAHRTYALGPSRSAPVRTRRDSECTSHGMQSIDCPAHENVQQCVVCTREQAPAMALALSPAACSSIGLKHLQCLANILLIHGGSDIVRLGDSACHVASARVEERTHSDLGHIRTRDGACDGPATLRKRQPARARRIGELRRANDEVGEA